MTGFADFRPGAVRAPRPPAEDSTPRVKAWEPMQRERLSHGRVLAFDPSLSATGVVALTHYADGLRVLGSWTLKSAISDALVGWDKIYAQGEDLAKQFVAKMAMQGPDWYVVHEAPPLGGGRINAPESAILAGAAVRYAAATAGLVLLPSISPRAHKKATVGNANVDKKAHHQMLRDHLLRLRIDGTDMITNESQRDAISVALTAFWRGL
jgi:hypothetical protein